MSVKLLIANKRSLKHELRTIPALPGVYLFRDKSDSVIYVGKAKKLNVRVRSYFGKGDGRSQIEYLLARVRSVETIVTQTEAQAFVLESDLIKKFKPRYNIRLKDDKAYLNVRIDKNNPWPRIELTRRPRDDGATYYGPFTFSSELRGLLEVIREVVPLRTCSDTIFNNRQRPCLEYEIKRCAGPCCLDVDREEYRTWVRQAEKILKGATKEVIIELTETMELASSELNFELAAILRDKIAFLENFSSGRQLVSFKGENRDVFALYRERELASLAVIHVRGGRISGSDNYSFSDLRIGDAQALESAIYQYYQGDSQIPEEIIVGVELEGEQALVDSFCERVDSRIQIITPKRGLRVRLLQLAELNAREYFIQCFEQDQRIAQAIKLLSELCKLTQAPRRIECVDISNLQGSDIVASVVCFFDGMPDKSSYKRYKLFAQGKPDDFGSIGEIVTRRLKTGLETDSLPDLLIIDGGRGQLKAALNARDELGLALDMIALAKKKNGKPERIFWVGGRNPIELEDGKPLTRLVARIRDEAHRFAVSYHRTLRTKRVVRSELDSIAGIGPERSRRLIKAFGSVQAIKAQSVEEIAKAGRMPKVLAAKVLDIISA